MRSTTPSPFYRPAARVPVPLDQGDRYPIAFLEAFPRLNSREMADALACGKWQCAWRWPDDKVVFACAAVKRGDGDTVAIEMECMLAIGEARKCTVRVRKAGNYEDPRHFSVFVCPTCGEGSIHLVFTYRWSCGTCSGLPYRKQAIGTKVREWEKRDTLEAEVGRGRPKGMHHATYARKLKELEALRKKLKGPRAEAPREYLHTLQHEWI